jgi:hypothetical protein
MMQTPGALSWRSQTEFLPMCWFRINDRDRSCYDPGFLLRRSKLTTDLNELLKLYGKKIKGYVVEDAQFLDSTIFLKYNRIETRTSEIPSKILDAQIWTIIENNCSYPSAYQLRTPD